MKNNNSNIWVKSVISLKKKEMKYTNNIIQGNSFISLKKRK